MSKSISFPISIPVTESNPAASALQDLCKKDDNRCWKRGEVNRYAPMIDVDTLIERSKRDMWKDVLTMVPVVGPMVRYGIQSHNDYGGAASAVLGVLKGLVLSPFAVLSTVVPLLPVQAFLHARRADRYEALAKELNAQGIREVNYPYWVEPYFFAKLDEIEEKKRTGDTSPISLPDG